MLVEILGQVHQREHISKVVSDQLSFQLFWRRKRKLRGHRNWREERAEAATIKFEAYKGCSQHSRSHNQDGFKWTKCYKVVNCGPTSQWLHCGIVYTSISISGPPRVACEHIMNPAPFQCFVFGLEPLWITTFTAMHVWAKTSQELRMLSSITINCQITKIVMNSGSQLSEL